MKSRVALSWVLWIAAAILLALMADAAFSHSEGAWPLCVAAVACMVFANLDRISAISASASGINIALNKAEVSIGQLTRLIRMSAGLQLAMVQRAGRLGEYSAQEKERYLQESLGLLRDAGVSDADIEKLRYETWDRFVLFDYVWAATGMYMAPQPHDAEVQAEWEALRKVDDLPTAARLREFLQKHSALTDEREEFVRDYEYYQQHHRHRRADYDKYLAAASQGIQLPHKPPAT